jgi:thymidylate synthase (FAD)
MANVNEYSARYSVLDTEFYVPPTAQLSTQSTGNRQGRGETLDEKRASHVLNLLQKDANQAFDHYYELLNEDTKGEEIDPAIAGLSRELARIGLPLSTYTQWYWKTDLHNLLHFLSLRADGHAQWEIREYARVILNVVSNWLPLTFTAFMNYRSGGIRLSSEALSVVKRLIAGEEVDPTSLSMSPREWRELKTTLGIG